MGEEHRVPDALSIPSCINACDIVYPQEVNNANISTEEYIELEVILDSGAGAHGNSSVQLMGTCTAAATLSDMMGPENGIENNLEHIIFRKAERQGGTALKIAENSFFKASVH